MLFRQRTDSRHGAVFYVSQVGPLIYALSFLFYGSALATKLRLLGNKNSLENRQRFVTFNSEFAKKRQWHNLLYSRTILNFTYSYWYLRKKQHQSVQICFGGDRLSVVPVVSVCTLHWSPAQSMAGVVTNNVASSDQVTTLDTMISGHNSDTASIWIFM